MWTIILVTWINLNAGVSLHSSVINGFKTQDSCEAAVEKIEAKHYGYNVSVEAVCVKK